MLKYRLGTEEALWNGNRTEGQGIRRLEYGSRELFRGEQRISDEVPSLAFKCTLCTSIICVERSTSAVNTELGLAVSFPIALVLSIYLSIYLSVCLSVCLTNSL